MNNYGIRGIAHDWVENYIFDRLIFVEVGGQVFDTQAITIGVPRGSILGPLLYLIYVNDIGNSFTENMLSFADDTTLYTLNSNRNELYENANVQVNYLYQRFCSNKVSLNSKKLNTCY